MIGSLDDFRRSAAGVRSSRVRSIAFAILVAAIPGASTVLLVRLVLGASLGDYSPVHWDEFAYWRQIAQFSEHGFGGGIHSFQERVSNLPPYGAWGPAFPALYGTVGAVLGWGIATGPLVNLAVLTIGVLGCIVIARPNSIRLAALAAVLLTFWPIHLYGPTGMQEPLHFGFALLIAAFLARLWEDANAGRHQPRWIIAAVVCIAAASVVRPTWGFALVAVALLVVTGSRARAVAAVVCALAATAAFMLLFAWWAAPIPYTSFSIAYPLLHEEHTAREAVRLVGSNLRHNLGVLVNTDPKIAENYVARLSPVFNGWFIATLLLGAAALSVAVRRRARMEARLAAASLMILGGPLAFALMVYELAYSAGTRLVLAPLLCVCVLLVLVASTRMLQLVPVVVVITAILTVPRFVDDFRLRNEIDYLLVEHAAIRRESEHASKFVRYQPGATRWCNTALLATSGSASGLQPYLLLQLPRGIGISYDFDHRFAGDIDSRYVIADVVTFDRLAPEHRAALTRVAHTSHGDIYMNHDAAC